ncbi:MAG: glucosaminidase domain-containing protein [Flavobacteriaceae bacterium]|jgi:LysM repeat protein|nr:glucosaminidase domain-containing protein [Flavobacteriaceae bacterium]
MKKTILFTSIFHIFPLWGTGGLSAQTWKTEDQYIQQFAPYAVEEMEKYKIPASITLAQGLLETGGGQSRLAQEGKNHFGIKCKEDWKGKTMKHTDDAPNECFRVYDNPRDSYEDHSKFLTTRKHYANLFKLDMKDYEGWAHGLKKAGYATNPRYAYILIDKIKKYKLYEFDQTSSKEVFFTLLKLYPDLENDKGFMAMVNPNTDKVTKIPDSRTTDAIDMSNFTKFPYEVDEDSKTDKDALNFILIKNHPNGNKKYIVIPADTNIGFISKKFGINENKLMKWNELTNSKLKKNDILFFEAKSTNGNVKTYKVQAGETMHDISQKFGIQLKKLYSKNRMNSGAQPKTGQLIYLQDKKPK